MTATEPAPTRRAVLVAAGALALSGCASMALPGPAAEAPRPLPPDGHFTLGDGARLPYRAWLPAGPARVVALALHGFNDSRDAWEIPSADLNAAGWAVYAPDQRGFGEAPERGRWAGTARMARDAGEIAAELRRRHRGAALVLIGESMGGAVLMCLATSPFAPAGGRYVLVAPAVWGRAQMGLLLQGGLWLASTLVPAMAVSGAPVRVTASDNRDALIRLSRDPLTLHETRFDTLRGLVNLMDDALAAAPRFQAPALFLYGGRDELVPKGAMAAMWRALPEAAPLRRAYYPDDYHLMLRDLGRARPIGDVLAWSAAPDAPLPSGADVAAASWLATESA